MEEEPGTWGRACLSLSLAPCSSDAHPPHEPQLGLPPCGPSWVTRPPSTPEGARQEDAGGPAPAHREPTTGPAPGPALPGGQPPSSPAQESLSCRTCDLSHPARRLGLPTPGHQAAPPFRPAAARRLSQGGRLAGPALSGWSLEQAWHRAGLWVGQGTDGGPGPSPSIFSREMLGSPEPQLSTCETGDSARASCP